MPSLLPDPAKYDLSAQLRACESKSRRNGKVARLPLALREQINHLLDDGIPYKTIIERLGEPAHHLNEDNLSNWRLGGYQDYLHAQAVNDRARVQTEAAADVVRESGSLDPQKIRQVCQETALLQYLDTIFEHGAQYASDAFKQNPAKLITLINACSNMSNANIAIQRRKWRTGSPEFAAGIPKALGAPVSERACSSDKPVSPDLPSVTQIPLSGPLNKTAGL